MLEIFSFEECYASYFCSSPYYSKTPYNWNVFFGQMMSAVVAHMWLAFSDLACRLMFAKSVHTGCFAPAHRGRWTDAQDEHVRSGYLLNNWCCDYWNSPSVCKLRVVLFGSAAMWVSLSLALLTGSSCKFMIYKCGPCSFCMHITFEPKFSIL